MASHNSRAYWLITLAGCFAFCAEPAVSHPVDIEMTKRAYEELKVANREALGLSRQEHGGERQASFAMDAMNSTDMQAVFGNLLSSVLSTRNSSSSLKLSKVP